MKRLFLWVVDHPILTTTGVLILTAFFALQLPKLEIDASADGLMMEKDPSRAYYEHVKRTFGDDNLTVILVKANDVFTAPALSAIKRVSESVKRLDRVSKVESLTTVTNIKGSEEWLNTDRLVPDRVPQDRAELKQMRADALSNPVFVGNIVAADAKAAAINVYVDPPQAGDRAFNERFTEQIEGIIRSETAPGLLLYQIGMPMAKATLGRFIERDIFTLTPIAIVVTFLFLYGMLRVGQAVVIPMTTGLLSVVWAMGAMALCGWPVTVFAAFLPAILIAVGFTEDIHMITEYYHLLRRGKPKLAALRVMAVTKALPILIVSVTTIVGFASLITTDITVLIQFGYAASFALLFNFLITIMVVPTMLRFWPIPKAILAPQGGRRQERLLLGRFIRALCQFSFRWRLPILVAFVGMGLLGVGGIPMLKVNNDFLSYFKEGSVIRQRAADLHESMSGCLTFYIVLETHRDDGITEPDLLRRISQVQSYLSVERGLVDTSISIADYMKKMHREMNNGDPAFETIPDSREQIAQYLLLLDRQDVEKYVDTRYATANILIRHNVTSSWKLSRLLKELDAFMQSQLPPHVTFRYTGEYILINRAADSMAKSMVWSLVVTFAAILFLHAILFKSLTLGLLSMAPNLLPVFANFGLMGLLGIPLNVGTVMIGEITLGIVVDDTVHYMVRHRRALARFNDYRKAAVEAMCSEGLAVITSSVMLAAGFWTLVCSQFTPTAQFGMLSGVTILIAMVAELTLCPLMMSLGSVNLCRTLDAGILELLTLPRRWGLVNGISRGEKAMTRAGISG